MTDTDSSFSPTRPLQGRVLLVTGASGSLGQVACRALGAAGATVLLLARKEKALDSLYDTLVAAGAPMPVVIPLDLAAQKDAQFEELALTIEAQVGRLDGIGHFATHFVRLSPLAEQHLSDWERAFAVNTLAPFALTRACLPLLTRAPDAAVLFCAEAHALAPRAYWGGFAASQAALPGISRMFCEEHEAHSALRFNLLIPGAIQSTIRELTHPGETRAQRRPAAELAPVLLEWLGPASSGRSGEVIRA